MPGGGTLTIDLTSAWLDGAGNGKLSGGFVRIEVRDTGKGISSEHPSRVSESFFNTKDADKEAGRGLSQIHSLAEQSRGHVAVASRLGIPSVEDNNRVAAEQFAEMLWWGCGSGVAGSFVPPRQGAALQGAAIGGVARPCYRTGGMGVAAADAIGHSRRRQERGSESIGPALHLSQAISARRAIPPANLD